MSRLEAALGSSAVSTLLCVCGEREGREEEEEVSKVYIDCKQTVPCLPSNVFV